MWSALAGVALQAIGSAVGQIISSRANKERDRVNRELYREQVRDANQQQYTDYLKTDSGQAMLNELKDEYRNTLVNATQNGMRRGASEEQQHATRKQVNDTYAKAFGQLSQAAQAYKQAGLGQYNTIIANARNAKAQADNARLAARSQSAMNLASNAGKTGQAMIGAFGENINNTNNTDSTTQTTTAQNPNDNENKII